MPRLNVPGYEESPPEALPFLRKGLGGRVGHGAGGRLRGEAVFDTYNE